MALPQNCVRKMLHFLARYHSADDVHEMILICLDQMTKAKGRAADQAMEKELMAFFKQRNRETNMLYNPRRNISMNQCLGDSDTPVSEWMNLTEWREWDS